MQPQDSISFIVEQCSKRGVVLEHQRQAGLSSLGATAFPHCPAVILLFCLSVFVKWWL